MRKKNFSAKKPPLNSHNFYFFIKFFLNYVTYEWTDGVFFLLKIDSNSFQTMFSNHAIFRQSSSFSESNFKWTINKMCYTSLSSNVGVEIVSFRKMIGNDITIVNVWKCSFDFYLNRFLVILCIWNMPHMHTSIMFFCSSIGGIVKAPWM